MGKRNEQTVSLFCPVWWCNEPSLDVDLPCGTQGESSVTSPGAEEPNARTQVKVKRLHADSHTILCVLKTYVPHCYQHSQNIQS